MKAVLIELHWLYTKRVGEGKGTGVGGRRDKLLDRYGAFKEAVSAPVDLLGAAD